MEEGPRTAPWAGDSHPGWTVALLGSFYKMPVPRTQILNQDPWPWGLEISTLKAPHVVLTRSHG
jgi:hypothetical protein